MSTGSKQDAAWDAAVFIGIEGGATRTTAIAADRRGTELKRYVGPAANLKLLTDDELEQTLAAAAASLPAPTGIGMAFAGGWDEPDWSRMRELAARIWPGVPCLANNDLEGALLASSDSAGVPRVLILSGTGSCCYTRNRRGEVVKVGGWGHVLGDQGSGYDAGRRALRLSVSDFDRSGRWSCLGRKLLRHAAAKTEIDLINWAQRATKDQVAALSPIVFKLWAKSDELASIVVEEMAEHLAKDAAACARKAFGKSTVHFAMAGGVMLSQPGFADMVFRRVRKALRRATYEVISRETVWGAVEMARRASELPRLGSAPARQAQPMQVTSSRLSPTELRNPRSMTLDTMKLDEAVRLMLSEEAKVTRVLLRERSTIVRVIRAVTRSLTAGGRLFYVGCGTSGRLGVLDASECPPTFQTAPEMVQGIIGGGAQALWQSMEGAEDSFDQGAQAIKEREVSRRDIVIGIAASGTTPFVWGAIQASKFRKATTVLVSFNPYLKIPPKLRPSIQLCPALGPEVLTGSTRLKAGTATKLLLNLFSTLSMVQLGKVRSNLMIDVKPSNAKLRRRAVRICRELTGSDEHSVEQALSRANWDVRKALAMLESDNS